MESRVEEYIKAHTRNCSNEFEPQKAPPSVYNPWLTPDHAREAAKIAREEAISKAIEWLERNYDSSRYLPNDTGYYGNGLFIYDFKKALEDE